MNNIILSGRITANPELKKTNKNNSYCKFTLAVRRAGKENITDFINCICWNKLAEATASYIEKGQSLVVNGRLQIDKQNDKYYTNVVVNELDFGAKTKNNEDFIFIEDDSNEFPF